MAKPGASSQELDGRIQSFCPSSKPPHDVSNLRGFAQHGYDRAIIRDRMDLLKPQKVQFLFVQSMQLALQDMTHSFVGRKTISKSMDCHAFVVIAGF